MDGRDARLKPGSFAAVLLAQHFMEHVRARRLRGGSR